MVEEKVNFAIMFKICFFSEETWAFHVVAAEQIRQEFGKKQLD
jgi:hypothetical protein